MSNILQDADTIGFESDRVTVRMAHAEDDACLRRIAELDSSERLDGPTLIAEVDGRPVAAHSTGDGRTVANPFVPTAAIVELLEARAESLRGGGGSGGRQRGWRTTGLRAAPASSSRRTGVV